MADIFLSYARKDRGRAEQFARALGEAGYSVWFDAHIPTASRWNTVLADQLERARCVVMLWSAHASRSTWVRREGLVGLERAALVPVKIAAASTPRLFGSIQFADLASWDGDKSDPVFADLLRAIDEHILPTCRLTFVSPFELERDGLTRLYEAYLDVAARVGCVPSPGRFSPPQSPEEKRRLNRIVASLQVSIDWHPILVSWFGDATRSRTFFDRTRRIQDHVPLLWLRLLEYSGPFFFSAGPRAHENFLRFASLMFFHQMYWSGKSTNRRIPVPAPLAESDLQYPRWEGCVSALFREPEEVAVAYVTEVDGFRLLPEETIYAPRSFSQLAYGRSLQRSLPYAQPTWLEQYLILQRELRLALEGTGQPLTYLGNARIRKITDLNGNDLPPLRE